MGTLNCAHARPAAQPPSLSPTPRRTSPSFHHFGYLCGLPAPYPHPSPLPEGRGRSASRTRAPNQDPRQEDQHAAEDYLDGCGDPWRFHVAVADVGDGGQLEGDDADGDGGGEVEAGDEVGHGV